MANIQSARADDSRPRLNFRVRTLLIAIAVLGCWFSLFQAVPLLGTLLAVLGLALWASTVYVWRALERSRNPARHPSLVLALTVVSIVAWAAFLAAIFDLLILTARRHW